MTRQSYVERLGEVRVNSLQEMTAGSVDRNRWRRWAQAPHKPTLRDRGLDKEKEEVIYSYRQSIQIMLLIKYTVDANKLWNYFM